MPRGGARPGAGRKPKPESQEEPRPIGRPATGQGKKFTLYLPQEAVDALATLAAIQGVKPASLLRIIVTETLKRRRAALMHP